MSMHNVVVSINGTERNFIAAFIKSVMNEAAFTSQHSLFVRIKNREPFSDVSEVDTELDTVNWGSVTSFFFDFIIDSYAVLRFVRSIEGSTKEYSVSANFAGVNYNYSSSTPNIEFMGSSNTADNLRSRTWKYQIFSNENALYLIFGSYSDVFPLSEKSSSNVIKPFQVFSYKNSSVWFGGFNIGANLHDKTGILSVVKNRLEYTNDSTDPTNVEVIQSKVAVQQNASDKTVTMTNVWDSSFNSAVKFPVSINNASYVYLNNYTLMPI